MKPSFEEKCFRHDQTIKSCIDIREKKDDILMEEELEEEEESQVAASTDEEDEDSEPEKPRKPKTILVPKVQNMDELNALLRENCLSYNGSRNG